MPQLPQDRRTPATSRLPESHPRRADILDIHERALQAGLSRYPDPATGFWVFTAAYLWERGRCCDTGCRHCPYVEPR